MAEMQIIIQVQVSVDFDCSISWLLWHVKEGVQFATSKEMNSKSILASPALEDRWPQYSTIELQVQFKLIVFKKHDSRIYIIIGLKTQPIRNPCRKKQYARFRGIPVSMVNFETPPQAEKPWNPSEVAATPQSWLPVFRTSPNSSKGTFVFANPSSIFEWTTAKEAAVNITGNLRRHSLCWW